jgi:lysyl-tRNA synthetase, class II
MEPRNPGELREFLLHRREKLARWREAGVDPYPFGFQVTHRSGELKARYEELAQSRTEVRIAGRIMALRGFGKSTFAQLQDVEGRIQVYFQIDKLGSGVYERVGWLDLGDIVGVAGTLFTTRTGEKTVAAVSFELLAKSLEPLPEKWHGLADKELRYRRRYVDLAVNPEVQAVFVQRARALSALRAYLDARGFLEVETPVLQPLYGGASARPFVTHHNALDMALYLRIADELYLKRLIVGGFEKVYEVCKDFRNEGMDRDHNPEFTMIEFYWAYADYRDGMRLTRELVQHMAEVVCGSGMVPHRDGQLKLEGIWPERPYLQALAESLAQDPRKLSDAQLAGLCEEAGQAAPPGAGRARLYDLLFKLKVEPHLQDPVFIVDYPRELSPLAKAHRNDPDLVERFELFAGGSELANGFSELNDPHDQRQRFEQQMELRAHGDLEAQVLDEDYLRALEFGMPPTAGVGIGFDRVVMLLTNQRSIRDVLLFPQMRPETALPGGASGPGNQDDATGTPPEA